MEGLEWHGGAGQDELGDPPPPEDPGASLGEK